ncbi:MAG TPA: hypothetical protein VIX80_03895 [Candidatus Kapabacteria bacterium]
MRKIIYILLLCAMPIVGFGQARHSNLLSTLDYDTCAHLRDWEYGTPSNPSEYKMQYDTLRRFIELCANEDNTHLTFTKIRAACQNFDQNDTARYRVFREWLVSVIFLNTKNPLYFCAVVNAIANTYAFSEGERYPNAPMTIFKYMMDNNYCPEWGWDELYRSGLNARLYYWRLGDTTVPFDSTLHDLDSLGLGFLKKLDVSHEKPVLSSVYLGGASVVPNPMTGSTTLKYELLRSGFIGYTIHDALGNQVFARRSDFADAGKHEEQIILSPSLSSGTCYLRLNVGFGEIRTIRMVVVK